MRLDSRTLHVLDSTRFRLEVEDALSEPLCDQWKILLAQLYPDGAEALGLCYL